MPCCHYFVRLPNRRPGACSVVRPAALSGRAANAISVSSKMNRGYGPGLV